MTRGLRRLRNLDLEVQDDAEHVQGEGFQTFEGNENNENLQSPPDIDGLLAQMPNQPQSPIKIIWPNGQIRQVPGNFRVSNLLELEGGKVMVGTDENGVPNERSASILGQHLGHVAQSSTLAPLDIQRWDNEMFKTHKIDIIKDVEEKFAFPRQTIQLTRDWILKTVINRWRAYKSKLKKLYFNRAERSLDEIINGKPLDVNEHQWRSLVQIWCQENHKKLCTTNSSTAKEQKNPHTTGRKNHARLRKELEKKEKRKLHRLELWETAHKKKNGRYTTHKIETLMDASYVELQKRRENNNGQLSETDFNEVFHGIVGKELNACGYYDDKYWSDKQVSRGVTFVTQTEEERRRQQKVNAMENKMQRMTVMMKQWLAFMSKKFPEEDLIDEMEAALYDEDDLLDREGDDSEQDCSDDDIHGNYGNNPTDDNYHEYAFANPDSPSNHGQERVQQAPVQKNSRSIEDHTSLPNDQQTIAKEAHIQTSTPSDKGDAGTNLTRDPILANMRSRRVKASRNAVPESRQMRVHLLSLRNKGRVVAKGKLVATDSNREIGECQLGREYVGVYIDGLENIAGGNKGDEELPRPFYEVKTLADAVGYVVA